MKIESYKAASGQSTGGIWRIAPKHNASCFDAVFMIIVIKTLPNFTTKRVKVCQ